MAAVTNTNEPGSKIHDLAEACWKLRDDLAQSSLQMNGLGNLLARQRRMPDSTWYRKFAKAARRAAAAWDETAIVAERRGA